MKKELFKKIYSVIIFIFSVVTILILLKIIFLKIFFKKNKNKEYYKTFHSLNPIIFTIDNFLSDNEYNQIIKLSKNNKFQRGYVLNTDSENTISQMRTNSLIWINHDTNKFTKKIVKRISSLIKLPIENAEDIQLIRYQKNEEYKHHLDAFGSDTKLSENQRLYTALVYLTEVEKGGETDFRELNIKIKPKKGKIIVFQNCLNDNKTPHPDSIHAGLPVLEGEKYAFNLWFHEKYYRK